MAQVSVETDPIVPGRWRVRSEHPAALAAVSDVIVQSLGCDGDVLSAWALHYDEQNENAEDAYTNERTELGIHARAEVVVLPRAWRPHTVWIDRVHLVATSAPPRVGSRLLGLYAGSQGDITLAIHDVSVTGMVVTDVAQLTEASTDQREGTQLVHNCRFVVSYHRERPDSVLVLAPTSTALPVQQALFQLPGLVAAW